MQVQVRCPGPGMDADIAAASRADVVVAVNRAGIIGCDWWVIGDRGYLWDIPGQPRVGMCTCQAVMDQDMPSERIAGLEWVLWEDLRQLGGQGRGEWLPLNYSMAAALALVHQRWRGASVTVCGCRWSGVEEWDGSDLVKPSKRKPSRWSDEREQVRQVVARLGMEVEGVPWSEQDLDAMRQLRDRVAGKLKQRKSRGRAKADQTEVRTVPVRWQGLPVPPMICPLCGRGMQPRVLRTRPGGERDCRCQACGRDFVLEPAKARIAG